jgi:outer membrane receptor protein involved in Fe transport
MFRKVVLPVVSLITVALVGLVGAAPVQAQEEIAIRGQVVAEADRSAVSGTQITLREETGQQAAITTTDESGAFSLQHLRPGVYTLTAEHDGFEAGRLQFVLKPREIKVVALALAIRTIQQRVDVNANPVSLPSTYSPSSTIVRSAQFDEMPAGQRTNLPDAIVAAVPGMIRGHDDFVHVRGQELALNTIIDGVSFWENPHALFSGGITPEVIDVANVMTGGFPAEYGSRFGGVIDIVTKSGFGQNRRGSVTANVGEANRRNTAGEFGDHGDKLAYYLAGSLFQSDRFLSPPDPEAAHDHGHGGHGFFQFDARPNNVDALRMVLMLDGTNFDIPETPLEEMLRPAAQTNQSTRQQTAILGWSRTFSSDSLLHTSFYQRSSRARLLPASGPLTAIAGTDRRLSTLGVKSDLTRFAGRHTVKVGIDAVRLRPDETLFYDDAGARRFNVLINVPHVDIDPIMFEQQRAGGQVGAYAQDSVKLGDAITADLGIRLDRYRVVVARTHASPRVNLAYRLGSRGTTVHASYDHLFVPPPMESILSSSAGLTEFVEEIGKPLPALPPTVENQFEVGVIQPFSAGTQLGVTGYYRRGRDAVHTIIWPDARIYSYASFDRSLAYGIEARLAAPLIRELGLSGYFNYALGRVYLSGPVTGGFITEVHHLEEAHRFLAPMDQTHTLTGGITYRHAQTGLWTNVALEYGSGTPTEVEKDEGVAQTEQAMPDSSPRVPGHFTANVSAGADVWHDRDGKRRIGLRLTLENVTNNLYKVAQESVFAAGQYSIPRLISAGVTVGF